MRLSNATIWPEALQRFLGERHSVSDTIARIRSLAWPVTDLDEALFQMAQQTGLLSKEDVLRLTSSPVDHLDPATLDRWLDVAAGQMSVEVETVSAAYGDVARLLYYGAPALVPIYATRQQLHDAQTATIPNFLILLKGGRWRVTLLGADGAIHRYPTEMVRAAICAALEVPLQPTIEALLNGMAMPDKRRHEARAGLLYEELRHLEIPGFRLLRLTPGNDFWRQVRQAGLAGFLWTSALTQGISFGALLICLELVKRATEEGDIVWATLIAGLLTVLAAIPFYSLATWLGFIFNYGASVLVKQRLFYGVLHLDLNDLQLQGVGQFLSWLIESETLQEVGLTRAVLVTLAVVPLIVINLALFIGGDFLIGFLMLGWFGVTTWLGYRLCLRYITLNAHHTEMITNLLERIRGHQTRLVQEDNWHEADDRDIADYMALAQQYDHENLRVWVLVPYGWIVLMLLGIATDFVVVPGLENSTSVGLRFQAFVFGTFQFQFLALVIPDIARAYAAWRLIEPIQRAATQRAQFARLSAETGDEIDVQPEDLELLEGVPLIEGRGLTFRYREGGRAILSGCNLAIYHGDRLLLEGPSGGGKSTLASLLIGLHTPETGLLLLRGLDRYTVNEQIWRQRVVAAPQFHENHVLNASLAFNLLMGRRWPAWPEDLEEAELICRELGLGPLLDRMPLGLHQLVGEQGWRLSHGERSRLYIARALLQNADLVILDESFASLDPENMQIALECVLKRAATLFVIAHP
ncbi:ABC transporter ATP-binding protein/permease [Chloroflexi bacterium TSY]|nr:ABC transporter ATP-binding protein/permease [Chloroflexi bacterium TSY]WAB21624.1 ABC transporter [Chloroflexota bacterium]